ncbi:MAG: class beta-lactamase [Segetibacter sp.]|nr:class beta-lactamase [Segetibacter sp.]
MKQYTSVESRQLEVKVRVTDITKGTVRTTMWALNYVRCKKTIASFAQFFYSSLRSFKRNVVTCYVPLKINRIDFVSRSIFEQIFLMKNWCVVLLSVIFLGACSPNNVTIDNSLKKFFDDNHVTGTFGIYKNGIREFTIYNLSRFKDSAYLPASTFKIVNSLVGLETGKIRDERMVIKWDGVTRRIDEWNKDLTMEQAFKVSAVPYYQEVARRVGKDTMQFWLDSLGYGARYEKAKIGKIDTFWLDNSIKITADEQLGLVKRLYFDQLPFQKRSMRVVKEMMVQEKNSNYTLAYKTGWGNRENGNELGWVVGWVEENRHPYFFALNLEGAPGLDIREIRTNVLKGILKQLGFLQGKM